ncbi:hypothetical protein ACFE04_002074 [Oxalis oulophora]
MAATLGKMVIVFVAVAIISVSWVGAQGVHHVVGGDRGWETASDVASWSSGRTFRVGDKIWFAYSAAHEGIVELKSKEEYEACDVTNPIKMYTDGIDGISLAEEGIRYFVSTSTESCKNGLKVPVQVLPEDHKNQRIMAAAVPPSTPSASPKISGSLFLLLVAFWLRYVVV